MNTTLLYALLTIKCTDVTTRQPEKYTVPRYILTD